MSTEKLITLKKIQPHDYRFLYNLLKQRKTFVNISHKQMPRYKEHVEFISSKPYSHWNIILLDSKKIGSIYLSRQNEIGISLSRNYDESQYMQSALEILYKKYPRKRYVVNTNPRNSKLIRFIQKNNFKLVQYSYELIK